MKVIVLCSGRTGSTTLYRACQFIDDFTVGHESRVEHLGAKRFDFPDQHIEIDNRLIWQLGSLEQHIGDQALYVHLKRERLAVKQSFINRLYQPKSIFYSYCESIKKSTPENLSSDEKEHLADDFLDSIDANIRYFLKDKTHQMEFHVENYQQDFAQFWEFINAKGDYEKALAEWSKKHNSSKKHKTNFAYDFKRMIKRYL